MYKCILNLAISMNFHFFQLDKLYTEYLYYKYYSLLSTFVMLIPRPGFRHSRHHNFDVQNFKKPLLLGTLRVISAPRSISDERHDDESSIIDDRRRDLKQIQFRNMTNNTTFYVCAGVYVLKANPCRLYSSINCNK